MDRDRRTKKRLKRQGQVVIVAVISVFVSAITFISFLMLGYQVITLSQKVDGFEIYNADLKKEVRLLQQKVDTFNAKTNANGEH